MGVEDSLRHKAALLQQPRRCGRRSVQLLANTQRVGYGPALPVRVIRCSGVLDHWLPFNFICLMLVGICRPEALHCNSVPGRLSAAHLQPLVGCTTTAAAGCRPAASSHVGDDCSVKEPRSSRIL